MTSQDFRNSALSMPEAVESGHMDHPDFRVHGKVFATLGYPYEEFAMVKLTPEEQAVVVAAEPEMFMPAKGAWGRAGSTLVRLHRAADTVVRPALELAYDAVRTKSAPRSKAPKRS